MLYTLKTFLLLIDSRMEQTVNRNDTFILFTSYLSGEP